MTRTGASAALVATALALGLALRLARLDVRPMHHDEANQAVKFGALLERGELPVRRGTIITARRCTTSSLPAALAARPGDARVAR